MSGLMDKAEEMMGKKEDSFGQPGDGIERKADDSVNTREFDSELAFPFGETADVNRGQ